MFKFRDLKKIKHFLEIKIFIQHKSDNKTVYLVQDVYVNELMKEYKINEK
jgi:hypothetical protein